MDIEQRTKQLVASLRFCPKTVQDIQLSDRLEEDLGMDSLGAVELLTAVEDEFGLVVDDADLLDHDDWLRTIGSLTEFLSRLVRPPC